MAKKYFWRFNTASVLIQLFNKLPSITCHGCFNTASVLIQLEWLEEAIAFASLFQYSFCSYSTSRKLYNLTSLRVSIQLLFLFNCIFRSILLDLHSFNTASVLIQRGAGD